MHDKGYFLHCLGLRLNILRESKMQVSHSKRISITLEIFSIHFISLSYTEYSLLKQFVTLLLPFSAQELANYP